MARPIVHIGYHKTATTWFQKSVYPLARSHRYVPRERAAAAFLDADAFRFDVAASRARLALHADLPPLICEEALCGSYLNGGLMGLQSAAVAHRIRAVLPDADIVIFVRAQPEMIAASYLQYVRVGGTHGATRFLWPEDSARLRARPQHREPRFSFDHFEYERLVSHYRDVFGPGRVHVYAFESLRQNGRALLERLSRDLAIDLDLDAVPTERRNVSYGPVLSRLARVLNRFSAHNVQDKHHWVHVPFWYNARKRLLERLATTSWFSRRATPDDVLGEDTVRWIRWRFAPSNARLAQLTGLDLRSLGYPLDATGTPPSRPRVPFAQRWLAR